MANINFLQYFSLLRYRAISKLLINQKFTLILDMEDSAQNLFSKKKTFELKKKCREGIVYLSKNLINLENCFLRINSSKSEYFKDDIKTIENEIKNRFKLKAIFLPKTENYEEIEYLFKILKFPIIPIIETYNGYKNLKNILDKDKNFNYIYGIHYGHFDYCLDQKIWPFPEIFHQEFWDITDPIINLCNEYKKSFIQTPYPLINNNKILWSMKKRLEKNLDKESFITLVSMSTLLLKKPNLLNNLKIKKISYDKIFQINFAKKIIKDYKKNMQENKSFSLTKKRFIAPHQFLMAEKFLKENNE